MNLLCKICGHKYVVHFVTEEDSDDVIVVRSCSRCPEMIAETVPFDYIVKKAEKVIKK